MIADLSCSWSDRGKISAEEYQRRFDRLAATGHDVHGEADFVTSLAPRSVLDAGCGTGRLAVELFRRGVEVVGVDIDATMLALARAKAPAVTFVEGDLADIALDRTFDAVVLAGNVMLFLQPGSEQLVVANLRRYLVPGGIFVAGFSLGPQRLRLEDYDRYCTASGLELEARFSTWGRRSFEPGADYAVSVHRAPRLVP